MPPDPTPDTEATHPYAAYAAAGPAKRCPACFYVLDHLPTNQCPECGRAFDPADPTTYTTKPPFVWWRYWLPGFLLAAGLGLLCYAVLIPLTGFGWAVTLAVPVMLGGLIGYSTRLTKTAAAAIAWLALFVCLGAMAVFDVGGIFCALILIAMAAGPLVLSVLVGAFLRTALKDSHFSQRHWLPAVLLFLLPLAVAAAELRLPRPPPVAVQTIRVIDAPLPAAWDGVMFYEEVTHDPPWLLRLGLRSPVRTVGRAAQVGDRKTCVYTRGHLTKQVTNVRPGERLEFAVVEQQMFEDYSVRLTGGSFAFEPVGPGRTRVTLTTRYDPLLNPRWAWRPVEEHVVHLLHGHVLEGMAQSAERPGALPPLAASHANRASARAGTPSDPYRGPAR